MSVEKILFIYVVLFLGGIAILAIYSELRRRQFQPEPTQDHIFRCEKCGFVYTDDSDVDRSRCSQCGTMNNMFEF